MFTGIISHLGNIERIIPTPKGLRLEIQTEFSELVSGESIAVNGVCLTVTEHNDSRIFCDLSHETLEVTTAKQWREGQRVNLERAMRPIDRFGGHIVLGHVDGVGQVAAISAVGDCWEFTVQLPKHSAQQYCIPKGSIAIDGISLTLNAVTAGQFQVMIIPHTYQVTHLHQLKVGDPLNLEFDYLVKAVLNQTQQETQP